MYEENQSHIPESFMMLHVKPHQYKPSLPRQALTQRYELCEDLANMLVDTASTQQFQLGITEDDALEKCWRGLISQPELVNEAEAFWVTCRLAELLNWPIPAAAWT
ncbi:MAG: hypothetical protein RL706_657 [Pseudomonadota bacterium]|jgi:hypothetical protein